MNGRIPLESGGQLPTGRETLPILSYPIANPLYLYIHSSARKAHYQLVVITNDKYSCYPATNLEACFQDGFNPEHEPSSEFYSSSEAGEATCKSA